MHYHPSSFHAPCRWHVRTYGLFAANPFGESHFTGGEKTDGVTLPAGESINMSIRVVIHNGGLDQSAVEADDAAYAATTRPSLEP